MAGGWKSFRVGWGVRQISPTYLPVQRRRQQSLTPYLPTYRHPTHHIWKVIILTQRSATVPLTVRT
eukprot:5738086-Prymnesium_polylepis.1